MKLPRSVVVTIMGLSPVFAGCGQGREGYVDFPQTAPSAMDLSGQPSAASVSSGSENTGGISLTSSESSDTNPSESTSASGDPLQPALAASDAATPPDREASGDKSAAEAVASTEGEASSAGDSADSKANESAATDDSEANPENSGLLFSPQSGLRGPADTPVVENSASSEPRKIEVLVAERHFRKERRTDAVRVTYDDIDLLKVLNMEPVPADAVEYFPEWLKSLNGKPVRIRGFMYPTFQANGLSRFTLARDNGICCFVRQPKIYDIIGVELADGITTDFIEGRPFDVEGIFHIDPLADEQDLFRLYRIDNARVLH
jgi:hypothetical protein